MSWKFPKIYPILDSARIAVNGRAEFLRRLGSELAEAGVTLMEYRNKNGSDGEILDDAAVLRAAMPVGLVRLVLDDRADLVDKAGFDGVHVDAGDVSPGEARRLVGPERLVGTFGGGRELVTGVLEMPADYLAVGPVYATTTKQTTLAPIGAEGVRKMRQLIGPERVITAAAGVTLETAPLIIEAGASAVAVAAALFGAADPAAEFRRWLSALG